MLIIIDSFQNPDSSVTSKAKETASKNFYLKLCSFLTTDPMWLFMYGSDVIAHSTPIKFCGRNTQHIDTKKAQMLVEY